MSVGRQLRLPGDTDPDRNRAVYGRAARVHGHDLELTVHVRGPVDDYTGMVLNFEQLKSVLRGRVTDQMHESRLDVDTPELRDQPATIENVATVVRDRLEESASPWLPPGARVHMIRVALDERTCIENRGPGAMELTRRYHFAASHRLARLDLDDEANARIFGKCANPSGHGHNYALAVTVGAETDPETGLVADARALDAIVENAVLSRFDHTYLNIDCPDLFGERIPTAENICRVIWELMEVPMQRFPARLIRLRLEETRDCHVEYAGPRGSGDDEEE